MTVRKANALTSTSANRFFRSHGDFLPVTTLAGVVHLENLPIRRFEFGLKRKEFDINQ
jgi:hypothetical protein